MSTSERRGRERGEKQGRASLRCEHGGAVDSRRECFASRRAHAVSDTQAKEVKEEEAKEEEEEEFIDKDCEKHRGRGRGRGGSGNPSEEACATRCHAGP